MKQLSVQNIAVNTTPCGFKRNNKHDFCNQRATMSESRPSSLHQRSQDEFRWSDRSSFRKWWSTARAAGGQRTYRFELRTSSRDDGSYRALQISTCPVRGIWAGWNTRAQDKRWCPHLVANFLNVRRRLPKKIFRGRSKPHRLRRWQ
jgi:hypothetical protein